MTAEQVYTVEEAAKALKVNPETVKRMLRSGKLGGLKVGRLWRVRESDLQEYLQAAPEPEYEYEGDYPVIPCKREGGELFFLRPCPYCGKKHTHGAGKPPYPLVPWDAGHRVAHCPAGGEIKRGRKWVKVPAEADKGYLLKVVEE